MRSVARSRAAIQVVQTALSQGSGGSSEPAVEQQVAGAVDHRRHDGAGDHVPPAARLLQQVQAAAHRQPEGFGGAARQAIGDGGEIQVAQDAAG